MDERRPAVPASGGQPPPDLHPEFREQADSHAATVPRPAERTSDGVPPESGAFGPAGTLASQEDGHEPDRALPTGGFGAPGTISVGDLAGLDEARPRQRTMFRRRSGGALEEAATAAAQQRHARSVEESLVETERYAFVGLVGEGAMGRIHLAEEKQLLRRVAFKKMSAEVAHQEALASKFALEARITAQLDHPNVVPVYSLESATSYTMKLIQGRTLEDLLGEWRLKALDRKKSGEVMPLFTRLERFTEVCDAIWYAHSRGVIHRDLKPENIMIGAYGEVYVMDWGIARVFTTDVSEPVRLGDVHLPDEGDLIIGTPGYMSPEQAEGRNNELDGASDQYALGLVLFELLTFKRAVTGKAPLKIVMRHQDGDLDPMTHVAGASIAKELKAIVRKATAKNRLERYPTVKDLADDVRRFLRGEEIRARPDGVGRKLMRFMAAHQVGTLAVLLFVIFGSVGGASAAFAYSQLRLSQAEAREQRVSNLLTTVAHQASLIDGQFLKYEGLLSLITATSVDALTSTGQPERMEVHYLNDFATGAVPDLQTSKRYKTPVSLQFPVMELAPGTDPSVVDYQVQRLATIRNHQFRTLLRSHSEQAATYTPVRAWRAIAEVGVPITWAYVGLETGVFDSFPGHGGLPDTYDPRAAPWYGLAKGRHGPNWGAPAADPSGTGLVLSCAQSLYDDHENFLGVAGIDVSFDYLIAELLEAPEFEDVPDVEFFLLDPEGRIAVRSSSKGKHVDTVFEGQTIRMPAFPVDEVVTAVKEKRTGYVQASNANGESKLLLYNRMGSIGWYYVVSGPADALLRFKG